MKRSYVLWAGSGDSFEQYRAGVDKFSLTTPEAAGIVHNSGGVAQAEELKSRLLSVKDGIALISVHGVLTNQDNWWNKYAGLVSYNEIRQAALEAAADPAVSEILLDVASPGGSVAGVKDAIDTLALVGKTKKITAYSDSQATSAGYWLMATADKRFASEVAVLGSIGVIYKHFEYTKAMEMAGETVTVLRSGEFKQLANQEETLSAKAAAELQGKLDHVYGVFTQSVANLLGVSYQMVDSKMAQGREFVGSQAVDAGLVDSVASFDKVYAATAQRISKKQGGNDMNKKYSMAAATAAAAGLDVTSTDALDQTDKGVVGATGTAPEGGGTEGGGTAPEGEAGTGEASAGAPPAETEPAPAAPDLTAITLLKEQAAASAEALVTAKVELTSVQKELEALKATLGPLAKVVAVATNNMSVALGGTADPALLEAGPADVLARHTAVAATFTETFKIGGVAATEEGGVSAKKAPANTAQENARLSLVKPQAR